MRPRLLCDEGIAYARWLQRDAVRVTHLHFSGQTHGFLRMGRIIRASGTAIGAMSAVMKQVL